MDVLAYSAAVLLGFAAVVVAILLTRAQGTQRRVAAETRLAEAERRILDLAAERDAARDLAAAAGQELAASRQRLADTDRRLADFEGQKQEFLALSKAAVLTVGQDLSSKLLEDHKRENEEAKKAGEEQVRKAAEELIKQLGTVSSSVAQLQSQVKSDGQRIETVVRALSNPSGAGQFGEIVLANTLKSFGLEENKDFKLQFTTAAAETGQRLRPDAVVFLPGDTVLVIDCKASKFLFEIAEAEGSEAEASAYENLARTMNQHLKALAEKDYRASVLASYRRGGFPGEVARVISLMYLPSEGAIERMHRADPTFTQRAAALQIIPAGPAGLACILGFASTEIGLARQIENRERIVETTRALLDSLSTVMGHAASLGRGIKMAAEGFEKLTGSVNRNLLPKARRLTQLGVQPGKPVPGNLGAYQVVTSASEIIEGEAEEIGDTLPFADLPILVKQAGE
jgi:DNA recombination protein RmuC